MTTASGTVAHVRARLGQAVQRYQAAVDDFDREVARLLGVNETAVRCLEILLTDVHEAAPSVLAGRLGVTTGTMTAVLDRLEKLGYITRSPDPADRRKLIIRPTGYAARRAREMIGPLIKDGHAELLSRYDAGQLELITDFLNRATDLQQRHVQRLRSAPGGP